MFRRGGVLDELVRPADADHGSRDRVGAEQLEHAASIATGQGMILEGYDDLGRLAGIITDGDLRRHMDQPDLLEQPAATVMTATPLTISRSLLAVQALALMEQRKITSLVVIDEQRKIDGVLHLHDLWRTQMF